jgi:hypothetical protein
MLDPSKIQDVLNWKPPTSGFGWQLSKVISELLQDCKADY